MSYLYLDNNILRYTFTLTKAEFDQLFMPVFKNGKDWREKYQILGTYFLVLEAVGIRTTFAQDLKAPSSAVERIKQFKKNGNNSKMWDSAGDLLVELFNKYKNSLALCLELSIQNLQVKYNDQLSYCGNGAWVYQDVVGKYFSSFADLTEYRDSMIDWLALDRVLGQTYSSSIHKEMFSFIMHESNQLLKDSRNNSFAKFYFNLGSNLFEEMCVKDLEILSNIKNRYKKFNLRTPSRKRRRYLKFIRYAKRINTRKRLGYRLRKEGKFGLSRDNVDSEMIHLLVCGYNNHTVGNNSKVNIVSSDRIEVIFARISLYKSYIQGAYSFSKIGKLKLNEGCYFLFNKSSKSITHYIDIRSIPPFFAIDAVGEDFDAALKKCVIEI